MTHKEFYFWLQGFLSGKNHLNDSEILSIQKKMDTIKDELSHNSFMKSRTASELFKPIQVDIKDDDELGKPPKIVM